MFSASRIGNLYKRGAVLIMTMMAICLTFMMVTVLLNTSGAGLYTTSSFYDQEAALQAAQSGVDYAVTQLQSNKSWRGDGAGCGAENSPIIVQEDNGNVVGLLKDSGGHISAFRIKFNFEKDGIDTEKIPCNIFADATGNTIIPKLGINMPYVSVNNLSRSEAAKVYRANNDGVDISSDKTHNWEYFGSDESSDATRDFANYVPPQRVYIVAEGLAGKGLRDCTKPEQVKAAISSNPVARRYVETYYSFNPPVFNGSAVFANGGLNMTINNNLYVRSTGYEEGKQTLFAALAEKKDKKNGPGQLCSNGTMDLSNVGELQTYHGKLLSPNPIDINTLHVAPGDKPTAESGTGTIEKITWDDVAQVSDENKSSCKLLAGFYQWDTVTKQGKTYYELHYYNTMPSSENTFTDAYGSTLKVPVPDPSAQYKVVKASKVNEGDSEFINVGPEGKIAFETDEDGNIVSPVLKLSGELYCDGDIVVCSNLDHISETAPKVIFGAYKNENEESKDQEAVLMGDGKITLLSSVLGAGAIVAKDNVSLVGSSIIDSSSGSVAVYSEKDVIINGFDTILKKETTEWGQNYTAPARRTAEPTNPSEYWASSFTPDAKNLYTDLINADDKKQCVINYFNNSGIYIKDVLVTPGERLPYPDENYDGTQSYFKIEFRFNDPDDESKFTPKIDMYLNTWEGVPNTNAGVFMFLNPPHQPIFDMRGTVSVPYYAYNGDNEYLQDLQTAYGSVVYGDTVINGVIYAKGNFKANLGNKFKLIVNGAVRAEQGNIDISCSHADLTYNEMYLQRLMPNYCKLSRTMWNCW